MNVGQDTTLGDGDVTQELVQLLVVPDGELQVTGDDTCLLVVTGSVASQLENLGSEVLEDGGQVDGSTGTNTLGVVALAEQTVDTADGERQTSLGGTTEELRVSSWSVGVEHRGGRDETRLKHGISRWIKQGDSRLRALGAAGLAAGLAASSHFDGCGWG